MNHPNPHNKPTDEQFAVFHNKVWSAFDDLPLLLADGDEVIVTLRRDGDDLVANTSYPDPDEREAE